MKRVLFMCTLLSSAAASANTVPSILPDGKYEKECQNIRVQKLDEKIEGMEADADGLSRSVEIETGTAMYLTVGDTTTIKDVTTARGDQGESASEDVTQRTIKAAGDGRFEETGIIKGRITKPVEHEMTVNYKRTFRVRGDMELTLTATQGDEAERPGRTESVVTKNADGSYTMLSYLREGFRQERKDHGNGAFNPAKFVYQMQSNCRYTPIK